MKILLANPRGFCAGVNMAIDVVDQVLKLKGPPVYVFHEIVHNRHVVDGFRERGVTFVDSMSEVPSGGLVVYSAHGVSPKIRQESKGRNLIEVDATCPLVTKVHLEVLRFAKDGYQILFIGHRKHDEAVGTVGEAPDHITVVESPEEVANLVVQDPNKLAYVTQTTLSISDASRIISALKARFPNAKAPPKEDICYATTNRQNAVAELGSEADLVLVIGSKNSSNSLRLVERAHEMGKAAHLIDDQSELDPAWFPGVETVMVTAGASAPEHLVQALIDRLKRDFGGDVELRTVIQEDVSFEPPRSLKRLAVVNA
ncbi:MAG TPA: 4-hydroxy-3-methylbut-2-enyl diphosphate reductase [Tepidisphaeraceae bacterium]|jgi:4-hydroxy-3-methylbut-2-enyl diphosphate reductase|nr:4-hydroxy-3-methylbut-2-enyl diphosphate reductase [Tepidisphaeraceae bacterium]